MLLYMHPGSPNSRRARIACRLAGVQVEEKVIDMMAGEQKTETYRRLNPMGKVPTLVRSDGKALFESHAIAVEVARGTSALPADRAAEIAQWMFFDCAHFSGPLGTLTFQKLFCPEPDDAVVKDALAQYRRFAQVLEDALGDRPFLVADVPTIADSGLVASLTYAAPCGVPLSETPKLQAWRERLERLPPFESTRPPPRAAS